MTPALTPSESILMLCRFSQRFGLNQRSIHQVLAQEPDLEFTGAKHIAYDHVVGAGVAQLAGTLRQFTAVADDDLVRVQQPRQLHGDLFASLGRAWNTRR